jgi:hypothetical protein
MAKYDRKFLHVGIDDLKNTKLKPMNPVDLPHDVKSWEKKMQTDSYVHGYEIDDIEGIVKHVHVVTNDFDHLQFKLKTKGIRSDFDKKMYYKKRMNDKSVTLAQRKFAEKRFKEL